MDESFATVLETVADARADSVAVTHGARTVTWRELDDRASRLASHLSSVGIALESRVGVALFNSPEYFEAVWATLKVRAVPVNVNFRYKPDEMAYIFDDAHVAALFFDSSLAERVAAAAEQASARPALVQVGAEGPATGAVSFEQALASPPMPRIDRGDDHWLMYTGGTTGMPRGVLSRHSWLFPVAARNGFVNLGMGIPQDLGELRAALDQLARDGRSIACLPGPPLMHGAGMYTSLGSLIAGGRVACLTSRGLDADEMPSTIERQRVDTLSIVGDVFAVPLAEALERAAAAGRPYDLSSLQRILSYGVTWSAESKRRLLAHGDFVCLDLVAASEGGPFAVAETRRGDPVTTARFRLLPGSRIVTDDGRDVAPGSGQIGELAALSDAHIRYLGDDTKTAETFRIIDGERYVVPGDLASVDEDGWVTFHGRGSQIINTGGEKVFAEEVENAVRRHPSIEDAMVVGVPDPRWGHRVAAVVALRPGATLTLEQLREHVGRDLADYKRPSVLVLQPALQRSPSGKADLRWAKRVAAGAGEQQGAPTRAGHDV
ncbi:MAG: AMP-binding protein [Dermatophilaceae bacterium]